MKPNKYFLFLAGMIVAYALFEYYRPKPVDWNPTYQNDHKIPFGTKVLFETLPAVMQQRDITSLRLPVYNHLTESKLPARSNYMFVCSEFAIDGNDRKQLLAYVKRGNNVFISAYDLSDTLCNMLGFKADLKAPKLRDTTLVNNFVNPQLQKAGGYNFFHDDGRNFLVIKKPKNITVLGRNARKEPIFIRVRYGAGNFYIHNLPLALTNFYVLNPKTSDYAYKALSYLPPWPTYWDEFQKQGRFADDEQSIFRYVYSQPPLLWAYYVIIWGLLFYVFFAGKRTQRIIPVVEPPKNTSLEFVQTVGRLYFQQGDHHNIGQKKIQYFLAFLRERFGLNTTVMDAEFIEALAQKSGISADEAADLVRTLNNARRSISLSEFDLLVLNEKIERFYGTI